MNQNYRNGSSYHQDQQAGDKLERVPLKEEKNVNIQSLCRDLSCEEKDAPIDAYNLVYLIFLLHGIGGLMPWNMFITAEAYFTSYKFGEEYIGEKVTYASNFLQYLTFASQIPTIIFNWLNIFVEVGGNRSTRIAWSISIEIVVFILTMVLAMLNTQTWPGAFFWITMFSVVILNMASGIYQNTIYGMAAALPPKYTGAIVLGANISGTFTTVVSILSTSFTSNQRLAAIYYFLTALIILLACLDTYFALPLTKFYRYHLLKQTSQTQMNGQTHKKPRTPYFYIFKQVAPQLFNIFFVFLVSLAVFPAVQANIKRVDSNFFISDKYFTPVTCFLTFNIGATLGSYMPTLFVWPKPKYLCIPVILRVLYIPFFLLSNYHISSDLTSRTLSILINNDWVYWTGAISLGVTSGYYSALGMMYAPRMVEEKYSSIAGMFASGALVTGLFVGVLLSFIWPVLIQNVSL